jgi:hypothetical protein
MLKILLVSVLYYGFFLWVVISPFVVIWVLGRKLQQNQKREAQFEMGTTNSLANLTTAVANETTVDQSVETLLTQLSAEIASASPTGDNPAIDALVTQMQANAAALAAAVTANTPSVAPSSSAPAVKQ